MKLHISGILINHFAKTEPFAQELVGFLFYRNMILVKKGSTAFTQELHCFVICFHALPLGSVYTGTRMGEQGWMGRFLTRHYMQIFPIRFFQFFSVTFLSMEVHLQCRHNLPPAGEIFDKTLLNSIFKFDSSLLIVFMIFLVKLRTMLSKKHCYIKNNDPVIMSSSVAFFLGYIT